MGPFRCGSSRCEALYSHLPWDGLRAIMGEWPLIPDSSWLLD